MNLPNDTHLAYIAYHEAWYHSAPGNREQPPCIAIMATYGDRYGIAWEFKIEEHEFDDEGTALKITAFDDAFVAFYDIAEFFAWLSLKGPYVTLDDIRGQLDAMGAADETPRDNSNPDPAPAMTARHEGRTIDARNNIPASPAAADWHGPECEDDETPFPLAAAGDTGEDKLT